MSNLVEVNSLSRRFGSTLALDSVSLRLESGFSYGLVGANGQGKTTLIKHLLGLYRPQAGSVQVFGYDPVRNPVEVLENIGYLSENRDLPAWMTVAELLRYVAAFHPNWDRSYERELLDILQLDTTKKLRQLSKGMLAQAGLIAAAAHRPKLLLLDEPSTGLDAVVRRDILRVTVRAAAENGGTVLFSSHLLDEVEMMSDRIAMIDAGRIVLEGDLDELCARHERLLLEFRSQSGDVAALKKQVDASVRRQADDGVVAIHWSGATCEVLKKVAAASDPNEDAQVFESVQGLPAPIVHRRGASLEDIFVAYASSARRPSTQETDHAA